MLNRVRTGGGVAGGVGGWRDVMVAFAFHSLPPSSTAAALFSASGCLVRLGFSGSAGGRRPALVSTPPYRRTVRAQSLGGPPGVPPPLRLLGNLTSNSQSLTRREGKSAPRPSVPSLSPGPQRCSVQEKRGGGGGCGPLSYAMPCPLLRALTARRSPGVGGLFGPSTHYGACTLRPDGLYSSIPTPPPQNAASLGRTVCLE